MADEAPTTEFDAQDAPPPPRPAGAGESPLGVSSEDDPFAERPEAFVGAAFAGGLALALILRRFAR
jgi:hypothetical protein